MSKTTLLPKRNADPDVVLRQPGSREDVNLMLPVSLQVPDDLGTLHADALVAQADAHEATLFFFDTDAPPILNAARAAGMAARGQSVRKNCVARIMISRSRLPEVVAALSALRDS